MHKHWGHYRYHHIGSHWGRHPRGGALWFLPGMILLFVLVFGVMKLLWPLLVIGFIFMVIKGASRSIWCEQGKPSDKLKNDEKPKRDTADDRRYMQTEDGDWLEII